jgi:hypothetical protein
MMKPFRLGVISLCLSLMMVSCSPVTETLQNGLQAEPLKLFDGDAKRYQPFLGALSGAVKLTYTGTKPSIRVTTEVWEYGVRTQSLGALTSDLGTMGNAKVNELIVSIKEQEPEKSGTRYKAILALTGGNGSASTEMLIETPLELKSTMVVQLPDRMQLSEAEDTAVWGFQATDENAMRTIDFSPPSLKEAKWVVLFKVGVADK